MTEPHEPSDEAPPPKVVEIAVDRYGVVTINGVVIEDTDLEAQLEKIRDAKGS